MDKSLVRQTVVVVLGAVAYHLAADLVLPWGTILAPPGSGYPGLQLSHALFMVLLSLPFALLLAWPRLGLARPVLIALGIAVFGLVVPAGSAWEQLAQPGWPGISVALDLLKFLGTLPLITWLAKARLPSNNSSKPTPLRGAA